MFAEGAVQLCVPSPGRPDGQHRGAASHPALSHNYDRDGYARPVLQDHLAWVQASLHNDQACPGMNPAECHVLSKVPDTKLESVIFKGEKS